MNIKKIVAFLLAAQMLLMSMAACGNDDPAADPGETKKTETTPVAAETSITETVPAETEPAETEFDRLSVSDELPEISFDGKDFRYIVEDKYSYQLYADDYTGDALNDVIYERNQRVESRFDIKISTLANVAMDADDYLVTYAQVGEHVAEVCAFEQNKGNTPAVYFCWANWVDVDYLNFDQPWWNKQAIEDHIINDVCYMISGDLSLTAMQSTWCMPFNMDLMEDWGYSSDYLYNLVWDGEWTLDKLIEITSDLYVDENGDGDRNLGDKFGYGTVLLKRSGPADDGSYSLVHGDVTVPWINALGEKSITIGDDGVSLHETLSTEKMYGVLEKMTNYHHHTNGVDLAASINDFVAGNIGIFTGKLDYCYSHFNDLSFSYGLLPFPKYDTLQENYITTPDLNFTMFGIPVTLEVEDYDFVGIIMEALNAESWKTVYPAYYEEALKGRYATDPNMAKMVDLITETRMYDYSIVCAQSLGEGMLPWLLNEHVAYNDPDLASRIARTEPARRITFAQILLIYDVEDDAGVLGADFEIPDTKFGE